MTVVRTLLIILALLLGWGAVRAEPAAMLGLLSCAAPAVAR